MIWRKVSAAGCALALSALALAAGTLGGPSASAATSPCTVSYSLTNSWPGGFQVGITITNNGAALTNWTLAFTFPDDQAVSNGWNASFTQNGQDVAAASESYNGALATGGSVSIGFVGSVGPVDSAPTYFTVNGFACNGAAQVPSVELVSPTANSGFAPGASIAIHTKPHHPQAAGLAQELALWLQQRGYQPRINGDPENEDSAVAGLGLWGPQAGASTSGARGEAALGPAPVKVEPGRRRC